MNREDIERHINEMSLKALKEHREYVAIYIKIIEKTGSIDANKIISGVKKSLEVIDNKIKEMEK